MQIVIELDEKEYKNIKEDMRMNIHKVMDAIAEGTVIPKGAKVFYIKSEKGVPTVYADSN